MPTFDPTAECWATPLDFPGYRVSDYGRVWSCWMFGQRRRIMGDDWRELVGTIDPFGYHRFLIRHRDGHLRRIGGHTLVMLTFVGRRPEGMVTCHRNGIPDDNRLVNLMWGTPAENDRQKVEHGRSCKGSRNASAKLDEDKVREILKMALADGVPRREISDHFGVTTAMIGFICRGNHWEHIFREFHQDCSRVGSL